MRKPVGIPATELPGDPALLPQSPQEPPQSSLHLPGAGGQTQLLPCFQWHKNKKADGTAPSAHPPTGSLGLSAPPPSSLARVPSQSMDHVIPRRGGTRELYPLPPSFHMTSLSPPPLVPLLGSSFLSFFPFVFLSTPSLPRSFQNGPSSQSQAARGLQATSRCPSWMGLVTKPPAPLPPPPYPLYQPQLGFHLPQVSVTTASHVRSSDDTYKGSIEELGCHLIRAHCLTPQAWGRMGIPDLRYLSCPRRWWRGQLSQGQGKEAPWLGSPLSSTDPSIFPFLSPSPLNSENLMRSAFISPNTYQPHPPCRHCPNITQVGLGAGVANSRDKIPQVSSPLPWEPWLQGRDSDIPLSLPTTTQ